MHIASINCDPRRRLINTWQGVWWLLEFDKCDVLWQNWRMCVRRVDARLVESGCSREVPCFLVRCSIPEHLGLVLLRSWQANIHTLLKRIPSISPEGSDAYFASINSKLTDYENMSEAPMLLELAIWKSKITQQLGHSNDPHPTDMRKRKRIDSVSMVTIIVPNILFSL